MCVGCDGNDSGALVWALCVVCGCFSLILCTLHPPASLSMHVTCTPTSLTLAMGCELTVGSVAGVVDGFGVS